MNFQLAGRRQLSGQTPALPKRFRWSTPPRQSGFRVVGERQAKDLPLNGCSFDNRPIALNPGAINYGSLKSANTSTSNGNTPLP